MRKFILALMALAAIIAPVALATAPADAAVAKHHHAKKHGHKKHGHKKHGHKKHGHKKHGHKNTPCMTKGEWNRLDEGMTRKQVKNVVGSLGKVTDRYDNSDGTFYISVDYRQCNGSSTFVAFETEVTYGDWVWDSCKDISDWSGNCIGGEVWDEWAETGITYTPRVTYVGAYYS